MLPTPDDARLGGLAADRACSTKAAASLAGESGPDHRASGVCTTSEIGARSFCGW